MLSQPDIDDRAKELKVLFVEDDDVDAQMISRIVRGMGRMSSACGVRLDRGRQAGSGSGQFRGDAGGLGPARR